MMQGDRVDEYLREALNTDDPTEKNYYLRQALQLLVME